MILLIVRISPESESVSFISTSILLRLEPVILIVSELATGILFAYVLTKVLHDPVPTEFDTASEYGVSAVGEMSLDPVIGAGVSQGASIAVLTSDPVQIKFAEVPILTFEFEEFMVHVGSGFVSILTLQFVIPLILLAESM